LLLSYRPVSQHALKTVVAYAQINVNAMTEELTVFFYRIKQILSYQKTAEAVEKVYV